MRPKRKEVNGKSSLDIQADHELFLQAFEKPTQIYRYLKTRNIISPIFLQRNLFYMRDRMSRTHKNRRGFKIDSLLNLRHKKLESSNKLPGNILNIEFKGFHDVKAACTIGDTAKIETFVSKILHKKRKESSSSVTQISIGTREVLLNPAKIKSESSNSTSLPSPSIKDNSTVKFSTSLNIPAYHFTSLSYHQVKSYVLLFKVTLVHDQENAGTREPESKRRRLNRSSSQDSIMQESEGTNHRENCPKSSRLMDSKNRSKSTDIAVELSRTEDSSSSKNISKTSDISVEIDRREDKSTLKKRSVSHCTTFGSELVVFDRHGRCQLTPGSYELVAYPIPSSGQEKNGPGGVIFDNGLGSKSSPRKNLVWESFDGSSAAKQMEPDHLLGDSALIEFGLKWIGEEHEGNKSLSSFSYASPSTQSSSEKRRVSKSLQQQPLDMALANNNASKPKRQGVASPEAPQLVLYQFIYDKNSRQQTEARYDFHCPWCSLKCCALYSLLKHLKLCHARFLFTYVPHPKGARIDVCLNELHDGSYAGNPMDLVMAPGRGSFARGGPTRRVPTTTVLVRLPKRPEPSLSEFLEQDDSEFDLPRSYILGHNRLYHHTLSSLPIQPHELDIDSEGEHDSDWVRTKTRCLIDDFTDVNSGEKELMKLWNLHVMKYNFVGDCQLPLACYIFIEAHGAELLMRNLYRNFLLHLASLNEFGLIGPGVIYKCILMVQSRFDDSIRSTWTSAYRSTLAKTLCLSSNAAAPGPTLAEL